MKAQRDATVGALLEQVLNKCRLINNNVCLRCEEITMELKKISSQKKVLQHELKLRMERIGTDLEMLQLEVGAFQSESTNLADQAEYGSMAQALQGRIAALDEEVVAANEEQALYGWKPTSTQALRS
eukprot:jgi/Tetstr1/426525/TSEL_016823.t1